MEEFASAAMIRLIRAGLMAQNLSLPTLPPATGAHVPLSSKREIARWLMAEHGPLSILRIADAVWTMPVEPILRALIMPHDLADLLDRWGRLERFNHSRHRVLAVHEAPGRLRLRHVQISGNETPDPAETLAVIGLLTVIMERIAPRSFAMRPAEAETPWRADGRWQDAIRLPDMLEFLITFEPGAAAAPPAAGPGRTDGALADRLHALVLADTIRKWTIGDLAAACRTSRRSLQRQLTETGNSVTQIIAQTRMEASADFLIRHPETSLAEISFLCGFSDQAHFNRAFKTFTGTTPREFRRKFRESAGHAD